MNKKAILLFWEKLVWWAAMILITFIVLALIFKSKGAMTDIIGYIFR
ncbi:MAG TPA: hypothetical protein VFF28_00895 [Candidatus Nanoarchaeia archaeon]|nr:hypothetical protein [Candidatus Nanoarchaeia archaeon]